MLPLWEIAVAPVFEAAAPQRVLEIGALRGETTQLVLGALGPGAELHAIDPVPQFDADGWMEQNPGRFFFYRDLSLSVLPSLPPMDFALIDGDHNWYSVYNELTELRKTSRGAGVPLPVFALHDVAWPYARRDLYYAPETIPAEFRQEYAQQGMVRDAQRLVPNGGLNSHLCNAVLEGGPRNGVLTALEDFVAEHDEPLRMVVLPVHFGLALVAEEARLAATPGLSHALDRLESPEGLRKLVTFANGLWLRDQATLQYAAARLK